MKFVAGLWDIQKNLGILSFIDDNGLKYILMMLKQKYQEHYKIDIKYWEAVHYLFYRK